MAEPLDGAWQKLKWAQCHTDMLREKIGELDPDPAHIPLCRKYEPDKSAIVWRVERVPEIKDSWGLVVGDALHNLRCALDYLWWQLAKRNLEREPTKDEAKNIQFPIFEQHWNPKHRYLSHVDPTDAAKIKTRQPFNPAVGDTVNYLRTLRLLSNTDKHRVIHLVLVTVGGALLPTPPSDAFSDCYPVRVQIQGKWVREIKLSMGGTPKVGNKIFEVAVIATGDNPDVDFDTDLSCYVALGKAPVNLIDTLDGIAGEVTAILTMYGPVFS